MSPGSVVCGTGPGDHDVSQGREAIQCRHDTNLSEGRNGLSSPTGAYMESQNNNLVLDTLALHYDILGQEIREKMKVQAALGANKGVFRGPEPLWKLPEHPNC